MAIDKEWLEQASLDELYAEEEYLCEEIYSIESQIEESQAEPERFSGAWRARARYAMKMKSSDRKKIRRKISEINKAYTERQQNRKDRIMIQRLRDEVGDQKYREIYSELKASGQLEEPTQ